MHVRVEKCIQ